MKEYIVREYEMEDYDEYKHSLTAEEVLNQLETIERGWLPDYNYGKSEDDFERFKLHQAIFKAIDVIKKHGIE